MRVSPVVLLAPSVVVGLVLAVVEWLAWARAGLVRGLIQQLQMAYGLQPVPWWGWADAHLHLVVSLIGTLWFGCLCRLFAPRVGLWLPPVSMAVISLTDELMQRGLAERAFEWPDLAAEGIGILLAIPLLALLMRVRVDPGRPHRATAISSATSRRSAGS